MILRRAPALAFAALPLIALAGCDAAAPQTQQTAAVPATGTYLDRFRALSDPQRNGVLLRAIRDAGHDCQGVTGSVASGSVDGAPAWTATCTDRAQWVVVMTDRGTATVVSAAALRSAQGG